MTLDLPSNAPIGQVAGALGRAWKKNQYGWEVAPEYEVYSFDQNGDWYRQPLWPQLPTLLPSEQKIVGLWAVFPNSPSFDVPNTMEFWAEGAFVIDYGDGTVQSYASNAQTTHTYDFDDVNLLDVTVTLDGTTNSVVKNGHGYSNGMIIRFYRMSGITGLTEELSYYVINASVNSFQLASSLSGNTAIDFTGTGSASVFDYKIALVTITPDTGADLTKVSFANNTAKATQAVSFLDLAISVPEIVTITLSRADMSPVPLNVSPNFSDVTGTHMHWYCLERLRILDLGDTGCSSGLYTYLFNRLQFLEYHFPTSRTLFTQYGYLGGHSAQTILIYNTSQITVAENLFAETPRLKYINDYLNFANATYLGYLFNFSNITKFGTIYAPIAFIDNLTYIGALNIYIEHLECDSFYIESDYGLHVRVHINYLKLNTTYPSNITSGTAATIIADTVDVPFAEFLRLDGLVYARVINAPLCTNINDFLRNVSGVWAEGGAVELNTAPLISIEGAFANVLGPVVPKLNLASEVIATNFLSGIGFTTYETFADIIASGSVLLDPGNTFSGSSTRKLPTIRAGVNPSVGNLSFNSGAVDDLSSVEVVGPVNIDLSYTTNLTGASLNAFFTDLPDLAPGVNFDITLTGCPALLDPALDTTIATNKGWNILI